MVGEKIESSKKDREKLAEKDDKIKEIKELERQLYFSNKTLPKRPNKVKILGARIKTKFQQLAEKVKSQTKQMVARIEIRSK